MRAFFDDNNNNNNNKTNFNSNSNNHSYYRALSVLRGLDYSAFRVWGFGVSELEIEAEGVRVLSLLVWFRGERVRGKL